MGYFRTINYYSAQILHMRRYSLAICIILLVGFYFILCYSVSAQINPWIQNNLYNPQKRDTAGQFTATPWLHPPEYVPIKNGEYSLVNGVLRRF